MKYSNTAITQLNRWYKQVLIKCAIFNSAVLVGGMVAAPAMATPGDINAAIQNGSGSYVLNTTETLIQNGVSLGSSGDGYNLTINGGENLNKINAFESDDTGIIVGAYGEAHDQTLNINNAKLSGFATALATANHTPSEITYEGHLNLNNVTFLNNTNAVSNISGSTATLNNITMSEGNNTIVNNGSLSLSGTNTLKAVSGAGTMAITAGETTVNGSLAQTSGVSNGGTLNISANNLASDTSNTGTLNLSAGTLGAGVDVTNTGTLNIMGVVTNSGTITNHYDTTNGKIVISGSDVVEEVETFRKLTTNASDVSYGSIENENTNGLILGAGTLSSVAVSGSGNTVIDGDVVLDSSTIAQDITINAGKSLTALGGQISGTSAENKIIVTNDAGSLTLTDGTLTNTYVVLGSEETAHSGTTTLQGNTTIAGGATEDELGTIIYQAQVFVESGDDKTVTNNGVIWAKGLTNQAGSSSDSTFINNGTIFASNGEVDANVNNTSYSAGDTATFTNTGDIYATNVVNGTNDLTENFTADFTNSGNLYAGLINGVGSTFANTGDGVVTGSVDNKANATLTTLANKIATADNATITNDGILTLTGGALSKAIANANNDTATGVVELQADTSIASTLSVKQYDVNVTGDSVTNAGTIESVTLDNTGTFTNSGTVNATTLTNNKTVDNSGNITATTVANTATSTVAASFTNSGTIIGDFSNDGYNDTYKAIATNSGGIDGNLSNDVYSEFENTGTGYVTGNILNNGILTTAADMIATAEEATIKNDGILYLTGGTLKKNIGEDTAPGTTKITGAVTLGNDVASTNAIDINANSSLDLGSNTLTLAAGKSVTSVATGVIKMNLDAVNTNGVGDYDGGHIIVSGGDGSVSGGTLDITVADSVLTEQGSSATLTLFSDYDVSNINLSGLYTLEKTGASTYTLRNGANAADTSAADAGSANNQQTADAWSADNGFSRDTAAGAVQKSLNIASHTNVGAYTNALTEVAPTDSAVHSAVIQEVNNLISSQIAKRLSGQGLSSGDAFTRRGAWASVLYNHAKQDSSSSSAGFSGDTTGLALGLDGDVNDTTTVGFGYAYSKSDIKSLGRKTDVEGHNIFAYAKYQPAAWYVRGNIGYGISEYKEKTNILGTPNSSKYDVNNYSISAYAGYDFDNGVTPEAGLRYTYVDRDDYTDALGQKVSQKNFDVLTAVIGTKYAKTFANDNYTVTPSAFIAATYDLMSDDTNALVKVGNSSYDVKTQKLKRFGIETGLDAKVNIDNWELTAGYELGIRDDFTSHTGMLKAKYNF